MQGAWLAGSAVDEVSAWVSANHQLPMFPQLQRLWPPSTGGYGASWPHCGGQLDWQGPGPGVWGVESPTGGCHPVSQAVISCSAHNWAVITLWPQMGCRCDYVLLASPCLRLLTTCCPWCPPPSMAPPKTQRQQPPRTNPGRRSLTPVFRAARSHSSASNQTPLDHTGSEL